MTKLDLTATSKSASSEFGKWTFLGICLCTFIASSTATLLWCKAMSAMGGMAMPGGWTMSMTWMTGPAWAGSALSFLGMWVVMMIAMMMPSPSLTPALWGYLGRAKRFGQRSAGWFTILVCLGYFAIWALVGLLVYPLGVMLAQVAMRSEALAGAVPVLAGGAIMAIGALQFTEWKARRLFCCRQALTHDHCPLPRGSGAALRLGFRLSVECLACCGGLMLALLVIGAMDPVSMVAVTAAITLERLAPDGRLSARLVGIAALGTGFYLVMQTLVS